MQDNKLISTFQGGPETRGLLLGVTNLDWAKRLGQKVGTDKDGNALRAGRHHQLCQRTQEVRMNKGLIAQDDEDTLIETFLPRGDNDVPHENIDCLIIFSSKRQEHAFNTRFSQEILEGTLLVAGTCYGFYMTCDVLKSGRPLFVFGDTGGAAALFNAMYQGHEYMEQATQRDKNGKRINESKWNCPVKSQYCTGYGFLESVAPDDNRPRLGAVKRYDEDTKLTDWNTWYNEPYTRYNLPYERFDGTQYKRNPDRQTWFYWIPDGWDYVYPYKLMLKADALVNNWPENFNKKSTLVVSMDWTPSKLTDQLTRVMGTVDEAKPELGGKQAETELLMRAWTQRKLCNSQATSSLRLGYALNLAIIFLTFATFAVVAVMEWLRDHYCEDDPDRIEYKVLFYTAVVLPLTISLLFSLNSKWAPMKRWGILTLAAKRTEAEIYRYRSRVGPYAPRRRKINPDRGVAEGRGGDSNKTPRTVFVEMLTEIMSELQALDYMPMAIPSRKSPKPGTVGPDVIDFTADTALADLAHYSGTGKRQTYRGQDIVDGVWYHKWEDGQDDYLKQIRAQQYLDWRLIPHLEKLRRSAPLATRLLNASQLAIFCCSTVTAFLAATDRTEWIAVVLAFAAAVSALVELRQLKHRVRGMNLTVSSLGKTHLWWQGLTLMQRRQQAFRERLVDEVEQALIDEIATLTATAARLDTGEEGDSESDEANGSSNKSTKNTK